MSESLPANTGEGANAARVVEAFLAQRDEPCPGCGYNLRGVASPRCPECSRDLALSLAPKEPPLSGGWAAFLLLAFGWVFAAQVMNGVRSFRAAIMFADPSRLFPIPNQNPATMRLVWQLVPAEVWLTLAWSAVLATLSAAGLAWFMIARRRPVAGAERARKRLVGLAGLNFAIYAAVLCTLFIRELME